jgi:hypothetical protein
MQNLFYLFKEEQIMRILTACFITAPDGWTAPGGRGLLARLAGGGGVTASSSDQPSESESARFFLVSVEPLSFIAAI